MSWVSKREDDEEQLNESIDLSSFSPIKISKEAVQATRLKFELENLKQYQQIVEYGLRKASEQLVALQAENKRLTVRLPTHPLVVDLKREIALLREQLAKNERLLAAKDRASNAKLHQQKKEFLHTQTAFADDMRRKAKEFEQIVAKVHE